MIINKFKHNRLSVDQKFSNKCNIKIKPGFTIAEIVLVMVLISLLYVVTTKVIRHNIEKKVPTYVYYLYKNLETENEFLTKKIIEDAEKGSNTELKQKLNTLSSGSEKMKAILETMDANTYCNAFAKDLNTAGKVDCKVGNSSINVSSQEYKNFEITQASTLQRNYSYTISDDGSMVHNYSPLPPNTSITNIAQQSAQACSSKKLFKQNLHGCHFTLNNNNVNNLNAYIENQKSPHWYLVKQVVNSLKINNTANTALTMNIYQGENQDSSSADIVLDSNNNLSLSEKAKSALTTIKSNQINIDSKPDKIEHAFLSNNNIRFHFRTANFSAKQGTATIKRNCSYNVIVNTQEVCPLDTSYYPDKIVVTESNMFKKVPWTRGRQKNINTDSCYINDDTMLAACQGVLGPVLKTSTTTKNNIITRCYNVPLTADFYRAVLHSNNTSTSESDPSKDRYTNNIENICVSLKTSPNCNEFLVYINDAISKLNKTHTKPNFKKLYEGIEYNGNTYNYTIVLQNKVTLNLSNKASMQSYYTKWNTFFTNANKTGTARQTLAAITKKNVNEATETDKLVSSFQYPKNISNSSGYQNHFIYVAIDTPFNKGEMKKNIFTFEQFGDKIIPVGFLANDKDSPLKFDIITRDPETFGIEKVNYRNGMEKRPLTFCEAMVYTGDKFSPYCGCKDLENKYPLMLRDGYYNWYDPGNWKAEYKAKRNACDKSTSQFGCIIKPVKPNSNGRF